MGQVGHGWYDCKMDWIMYHVCTNRDAIRTGRTTEKKEVPEHIENRHTGSSHWSWQQQTTTMGATGTELCNEREQYSPSIHPNTNAAPKEGGREGRGSKQEDDRLCRMIPFLTETRTQERDANDATGACYVITFIASGSVLKREATIPSNAHRLMCSVRYGSFSEQETFRDRRWVKCWRHKLRWSQFVRAIVVNTLVTPKIVPFLPFPSSPYNTAKQSVFALMLCNHPSCSLNKRINVHLYILTQQVCWFFLYARRLAPCPLSLFNSVQCGNCANGSQ